MTRLDPRSYLDRVRPGLVPIAGAQSGVCSSCRSGVNLGFERCYPCESKGIVSILPISMSEHNGPLHQRLRNYKDGNRRQREQYTLDLAALLFRFLEKHIECLAGRPDVIVTVPSPDRDAVKTIVNKIGWLRERHVSVLCSRGNTNVSYSVPVGVRGKRVLLLDDTFTTGSSIAATHSALIEAGAIVPLPLVIGRHFRPEFDTSRRLASCLSEHKWRLRNCGVCSPVICGSEARQARLL